MWPREVKNIAFVGKEFCHIEILPIAGLVMIQYTFSYCEFIENFRNLL